MLSCRRGRSGAGLRQRCLRLPNPSLRGSRRTGFGQSSLRHFSVRQLVSWWGLYANLSIALRQQIDAPVLTTEFKIRVIRVGASTVLEAGIKFTITLCLGLLLVAGQRWQRPDGANERTQDENG